MNRMHRIIEKRTGLVFGLYRPTTGERVWLLISPRQGDRAFSVIVGRRGFYLTTANLGGRPDA